MITNQGYWLLIVKDELSDRFTTDKYPRSHVNKVYLQINKIRIIKAKSSVQLIINLLQLENMKEKYN